MAERHFRVFRTWGMSGVDVQGVSREDLIARASAPLDPDELAAIEGAVEALFRHADPGHPVVAELRRRALLRRLRRATHGA